MSAWCNNLIEASISMRQENGVSRETEERESWLKAETDVNCMRQEKTVSISRRVAAYFGYVFSYSFFLLPPLSRNNWREHQVKVNYTQSTWTFRLFQLNFSPDKKMQERRRTSWREEEKTSELLLKARRGRSEWNKFTFEQSFFFSTSIGGYSWTSVFKSQCYLIVLPVCSAEAALLVP